MMTLSIRQPWAWAIINAGKPIENRRWSTRYRGPLLIHASTYRHRGHYVAAQYEITRLIGKPVPGPASVYFGGVIGITDLVDVVTTSPSPWFDGPFGLVLENAQRLPFYPIRGRLMLFDVPMAAERAVT